MRVLGFLVLVMMLVGCGDPILGSPLGAGKANLSKFEAPETQDIVRQDKVVVESELEEPKTEGGKYVLKERIVNPFDRELISYGTNEPPLTTKTEHSTSGTFNMCTITYTRDLPSDSKGFKYGRYILTYAEPPTSFRLGETLKGPISVEYEGDENMAYMWGSVEMFGEKVFLNPKSDKVNVKNSEYEHTQTLRTPLRPDLVHKVVTLPNTCEVHYVYEWKE